MAKDSSVNNAANKVTQSINTAASNINTNAQDIGNAITGAINNLGEGIKLTAKKDTQKKSEKTDVAKLKEELNGLQVFMPEMAEMIELLIAINTKFDTVTEARIADNSGETKTEEEKEKAAEFDTSARETDALSGLTSIVDIAGTGFSIVGNLLHDMSDLFATVLSGVTSEDLKKVFVASNLSTTANQKAQDAQKGDDAEPSKGVLKSFFENLAGPLESVASGLLLLSVAMAILNTVQLDSQLLGTVILLQAFMLTTFGVLASISKKYESVQQHFDTEGENKDSILGIVKQFSMMVFLTAATFLACAAVVDVLKENWQNVLIGLVVIFGTALVTMVALTAVASLIGELVGPEASISKTIKSFAGLVALISGLAIFCWLLYPIIIQGLNSATIILATALLTMLSVTLMMSSINASKEQIEAFTGLVKTVTVMISVIAVLTIILGIIPDSIIIQGLISVGLIMILMDTMLLSLGAMINNAAKVSEENLKTLMGILIVTTVLIGILGVFVLVLGSIDTATLVQGLIAVTLISVIPIVLLKVMSKIGQSAGQLPQALLGIAMASLLTVAVTAVAWLIITMLQQFTPTMVLATTLAVTLTTVMLLGVGLAGMALAAMATALTPLLPLALLGIGATGALAVAIAGVALLIGTILDQQKSAAALAAAGAIILTTTALVVVAGAAILLAALAIPLTVAKGLALMAIVALRDFILGFTVIMSQTLAIVAEHFSGIDPNMLGEAVKAIADTTKQLISLAAVLLAFNIISWTLVAQVVLASAALALLSVGMISLTANLFALGWVISQVPATALTGFENIKTAIGKLNELSATIQTFNAPGLAQMLGLTATLNFVLGFAKRLGLVASDEKINRISALSASLSALAQNATGLKDLAGAIKEVSEATKELNELNTESKVSIEAISGQLSNNATDIQKLQKPAESKDNPKLNEAVEQIIAAVTILNTISENLQNVTRYTKQMSTVQEMAARAPQSSFLQ